MVNKKNIEFKGVKEGIILQINDDIEFSNVMIALRKKLKESSDFFKGAEIVGVEGRKLTISEMRKLKKLIEKEFGLEIISLANINETKKNVVEKKVKTIKEKSDEELCGTKFIRGTLRSGRREKCDGNIIILGDVNPGAEVIAGGNIIVMGTLRGVAHAGFPDNIDFFVAAIRLEPGQLRIGNIIARSSEENIEASEIPEMAYVKNNMLIIEPYL